MRIFMLKSGRSPINYIKSALNFPNEAKLAIVGCIDKKSGNFKISSDSWSNIDC